MPRIQPLVPILRPLAAPRVSGYRPHFHFSTATRLRADSVHSNTSKPSHESQASSTVSSPSEASRAADLAATEAVTDAQAPSSKPTHPSKHPRASNESSRSTTTSNPSITPTTPSGAITSHKEARSLNTKSRKDKRGQAPKTTLELPPAKYVVSKTPTNNYPVYTDYKRGGNLRITTVRKITGDLSALRDELRVFLEKKNGEVKINALTQHVVVKGHHVSQITQFLKARGM